jgi:hypothetical protein
MPMYCWKQKDTDNVVEIFREFSDYETPPTKEEHPEAEIGTWERVIGKNIHLIRGAGWRGKKGAW